MLGGFCVPCGGMKRGMKTKAELTADLRSHFESHIFSRGREYVRNGAVGKVRTTPQSSGHLHIHAIVRGSDRYETDILFSPDMDSFASFECSCPYDDNCKHSAALGLAFIGDYACDEARTDTDAEHAAISFPEKIAEMVRDGAVA